MGGKVALSDQEMAVGSLKKYSLCRKTPYSCLYKLSLCEATFNPISSCAPKPPANMVLVKVTYIFMHYWYGYLELGLIVHSTISKRSHVPSLMTITFLTGNETFYQLTLNSEAHLKLN